MVFLVYETEITCSPNSQNGLPKEGDTDKNDTENRKIISSVEIHTLEPKGCYE